MPTEGFEDEKFKRLSKNKNFDNGNSLRMTEQEDILPCYISYETRKLWSRFEFTIFTGLRCFRLEAAFRNPSQFPGMF